VNNIHIEETIMYGVVERLDEIGHPAWILAMIAGFILFAPLGLAILLFLLWSGRMGCGSYGAWGAYRSDDGQHGDWRRERWQRKMERMQARMARWQEFGNRAFGNKASGNHAFGGPSFRPTGNRAFDEYRNEMLRRLEDEASEFRSFLERLRQARDKAEFDQYMAERKGRGGEGNGNPVEPRSDRPNEPGPNA